uniref:Oxoglutarate (alpha-ketoglutarate) receptor 1a, tandem duplicate 2 n=1 Tax=Erpetoichthys calabaricus TaxID=27687 RepID=A0A8C4STK2_ERPCA
MRGNYVTNNCTDLVDQLKRYYLTVIYSLIFILGVVGNISALLIYFFKVRPWKNTTITMIHIAMTDFLYLMSLPFLVKYYSNNDFWTLGDFMCKLVRFIFHLNMYGTIHLLMFVSIFRCIAVIYPLKAPDLQKKRWGLLVIFISWITIGALITPMLTMFSTQTTNDTVTCLDFASLDPQKIQVYNFILTGLGFFIPLLIVLICYIIIVMKLAERPEMPNFRKVKARRFVVLILVVFIICFLPYHVLRIIRISTNYPSYSSCVTNTVQAVYIIIRTFAGINTLFDLLLYTAAGEQFKKAFIPTAASVWHCLFTPRLVQL